MTSPVGVGDQVPPAAPAPARAPPPRRRNRRSRRETGTLVEQEVDSAREGSKRQRVVPGVGREGSSMQQNSEPTLSCPVCWNKLEEPSATICGHVFCTECIKQAIQVQKKCPTCRRRLRKNNVNRIYLPTNSNS